MSELNKLVRNLYLRFRRLFYTNQSQKIYYPKKKSLEDWDLKFPQCIEQEPTTACNVKCVFCPVSNRNKNFLPTHVQDDVMDKLCKELSELPDDLEGVIQFVGLGEPTISINFDKNVEKLKKSSPKKYQVKLNTNGTSLHAEKVTKAIINNVDSMTISINGFNEETYSKLNGVPGYEKTITKVQEFLKEKNKNGFQTPVVRIQIMDSKDYNFDDYKAFRELLEPYMADKDYFHVQKMMSLEAVSDQIDSIMSSRDRDREMKAKYDKIPCFQMRYNAFISANGDVYPCCIVGNLDGFENRKNTGLCIGNLHQESIKDIWNGNLRKSLIEKDLAGNRPKFCEKCSALPIYSKKDWDDLPSHYEKNFSCTK